MYIFLFNKLYHILYIPTKVAFVRYFVILKEMPVFMNKFTVQYFFLANKHVQFDYPNKPVFRTPMSPNYFG